LTSIRASSTLLSVGLAVWRRTACLGLALLFCGCAAVFAGAGFSSARQFVSADRLDGYQPRIDYRVDGYRPKPIPAELMPGYQSYVTPLDDPNIPVDAEGVALSRYQGRVVYHPLAIARYGIKLLQSYRINHDPAYLLRAEANANFLLKTAVSRDGALYIPYRFTFALFGNPSDLMRAPWYSAMNQGAALTLFLRLYVATGDQRWRSVADSTFATFVQRKSTKRPWIAFVPRRYDRRYIWFEEYAKNPPTQPLNGHIYALFGVYEYALTTGSKAAVNVFDGGVTTVRRQVHRFRVRGQVSYYSLRVHVQYPSYHCIHIGMLKLLTRMTGDRWFSREARLFAADGRRAGVRC
jgi:D-glucuronyl C5-epimerase C-terminus